MGREPSIVAALSRGRGSSTQTQIVELCRGELVEKLDIRTRRPVQALYLGISGFDYVVFVGGVGAASMAETEVAGREA